MEPKEVLGAILFFAIILACLAIPICIIVLLALFISWLVRRRDPVKGAAALHWLSVAESVLIAFLLVFVLYFVLTKVPVIGNRTWCQSTSSDGAHSLQADMLADSTLISGMPVRFTLEHLDSSGDVVESQKIIVYVPVMAETCLVEWGNDHVDVGAHEHEHYDMDYYFSLYWDRQQ